MKFGLFFAERHNMPLLSSIVELLKNWGIAGSLIASLIFAGATFVISLFIRHWLPQYRHIRKQWRGDWFAYHFTEINCVSNGKSEVARRISRHEYEFTFPLFGPHGKIKKDRIYQNPETREEVRGKRVYSCRVKQVFKGWMLECIDDDPIKKERIHREFYPDFDRETTNEICGEIVAMSASESLFSSPILLRVSSPEVKAEMLKRPEDEAYVENAIINSAGIHFDSLYPSGANFRGEEEAKNIFEALESGQYERMPKQATETEVDHMVDTLISTHKHLAPKILQLLLDTTDVEEHCHVKQYWACHLNTTQNTSTLNAFRNRRNDVESFLRNKHDTYVMVQLLRALHRDPNNAPRDDFMKDLINRSDFDPAFRGWALALLRESSANAPSLSPDGLRILEALLQKMIQDKNTRYSYMACGLAGYYPELNLDVELKKRLTHPLLFVREAARLAILRRRELRE